MPEPQHLEGLSDEEILGLIDLLNQLCEAHELRRNPMLLIHRKTGKTAEIQPLLKKLLREGINRGIVTVPPCFSGDI